MKESVTCSPTLVTRELNASQDLVFKAWTNIDAMKQWMYTDSGMHSNFSGADIREGGSSLQIITFPSTEKLWLLTKYIAITAPSRLVFRQHLANPGCGQSQHPTMTNWPKVIQAEVLFVKTGENKSRITLRWEPYKATAKEVENFKNSRSRHCHGWDRNLDALADYLSSLEANKVIPLESDRLMGLHLGWD